MPDADNLHQELMLERHKSPLQRSRGILQDLQSNLPLPLVDPSEDYAARRPTSCQDLSNMPAE